MSSPTTRAFNIVGLILVGMTGKGILCAEINRSPAFVYGSLFPPGTSSVVQIAELATTDVVVLNDGVGQGFRAGIVCQIHSGERVIGEILLVAVNEHRAAGLIISLFSDRAIRLGDIAKVKTVKLTKHSSYFT